MSDMTYTQAADEIKKLLRGLKAIDMISEALTKVGSIENAAKEAGKRHADMLAQCDAAKVELAAAKEEVVKAKDEAKRAKAKAEEAVTAKLTNAAVEAGKIVEDAKAEANLHAERVTAAEDKYAQLSGAIVAARQELSDIEAKIIEAKKQVAKILG